jgi:WD40 repeat protein
MSTFSRWCFARTLIPSLAVLLLAAASSANAFDKANNWKIPGAARPRADADPLPPGAILQFGTSRLIQFGGYQTRVAYSPKEDVIAAACGSAVRRWEIATGTELPVVFTSKGFVYSIGFFPDAKRIAVGDAERSSCQDVYIIDLKGENKPRHLSVEGVIGSNVIVSSNGGLLAAGGTNGGIDGKVVGKVWVWDPDNGDLLHTFSTGDTGLNAIALSPDAKTLAAGANGNASKENEPIYLWDLTTGKQKAQLDGHKIGVRGLAFSSDGAQLYSCGDDKKMRHWDVAKGKELRAVNAVAATLALSPNDEVIATSNLGTSVSLWDSSTGELIRKFGDVGTNSLSFSPNGKRLATAGYASVIGVWDVATGKEVVPHGGHRGVVAAVTFSPDGTLLASKGGDQTVRLWNVPKGTVLHTLPLASENGFGGDVVEGLAFAPDSAQIAATGVRAGAPDLKVRVWSVAKGELRAEWSDPRYEPEGILFTPEGDVMVGSQGGPRIRSVPDGKELGQFVRPVAKGPGIGDYSMALSPATRLLVTSDRAGNRVELWNYATVQPIGEIKTAKYGANRVALSTDARLLATGGVGHSNQGRTPEVSLWDVATGSLLRTINRKKQFLSSFAFSPDGRLLATTVEGSNIVYVWNVFTGEELASFDGHAAPPVCVAFSPDSKLLASGSQDTTILLLDVSKLDGRPPKTTPSAEEMKKLWDVLAGADGAAAFKAVITLAGAGDKAVELIKGEIKPAPEIDAKRVKKLLADLDAKDFDMRESATNELAKLGAQVEPALKQALKGEGLTVEFKTRAEQVLQGISVLPKVGEPLRADRALWILDQIGNEAAREELKRLAGGAPTARLTKDAKAALERLKRYSTAKEPAPRE